MLCFDIPKINNLECFQNLYNSITSLTYRKIWGRICGDDVCCFIIFIKSPKSSFFLTLREIISKDFQTSCRCCRKFSSLNRYSYPWNLLIKCNKLFPFLQWFFAMIYIKLLFLKFTCYVLDLSTCFRLNWFRNFSVKIRFNILMGINSWNFWS